MKFKLPLFLWISSLMAGLLFLLGGFLGPAYLAYYGQQAISSKFDPAEQRLMLEGWTVGLRVLGFIIIISSSALFLFRKKLSNKAYAGIFAGLMLISIVAASATAAYL